CCERPVRALCAVRADLDLEFFLVGLRRLVAIALLFLIIRPPPRSPLFPYTTLFRSDDRAARAAGLPQRRPRVSRSAAGERLTRRSEEHTSELQSLTNLVCRLLLEKKKKGVGRSPRTRLATGGRQTTRGVHAHAWTSS